MDASFPLLPVCTCLVRSWAVNADKNTHMYAEQQAGFQKANAHTCASLFWAGCAKVVVKNFPTICEKHTCSDKLHNIKWNYKGKWYIKYQNTFTTARPAGLNNSTCSNWILQILKVLSDEL